MSNKDRIHEKLKKIVELMTRDILKKSKNEDSSAIMKSQQFKNKSLSIALEDAIEDAAVGMEMHIDENYGEMTKEDFMGGWYSIYDAMEKRVTNITKNLS